MSSMAFTSSAALSPDAPDVVVDYVVTGNVVAGGFVGASEAVNVEGTIMDTVGMTVLEVVVNSLCFD